MLTKWIGVIAYIWVIILGVIILIPHHPPGCLVCNFDTLTTMQIVYAVVSIAIGLVGLGTRFTGQSAG